MAGLNTATPFGLTLQQTVTSGTSITFPAGVSWVYAILVGGGGYGFYSTSSGGGGGVTCGWAYVKVTTPCIVGAGSTSVTQGGTTLLTNLVAGHGGGYSPNSLGYFGVGGGGGNGNSSGGAYFYGVPAGLAGGNYTNSPFTGLISGAGGAYGGTAGGQPGWTGGGGGYPTGGTGGAGGNSVWGFTGGAGANQAGGGGAGMLGNGGAATSLAGGVGGAGGGGGGGAFNGGSGGNGGNGCILLYY